jgi:hypothetical protein
VIDQVHEIVMWINAIHSADVRVTLTPAVFPHGARIRLTDRCLNGTAETANNGIKLATGEDFA